MADVGFAEARYCAAWEALVEVRKAFDALRFLGRLDAEAGTLFVQTAGLFVERLTAFLEQERPRAEEGSKAGEESAGLKR